MGQFERARKNQVSGAGNNNSITATNNNNINNNSINTKTNVKPLNKHQLLRARLMAQKQHATGASATSTTSANTPPTAPAPAQSTHTDTTHHCNSESNKLAEHQQKSDHISKKPKQSVISNGTTPLHDMTISSCKQCTQPFTYSVAEQRHYAARNIATPVRCSKCRSKRKDMRIEYKHRRDDKQLEQNNQSMKLSQSMAIGQLNNRNKSNNKHVKINSASASHTNDGDISDDMSDVASDDDQNEFDENNLNNIIQQLSERNDLRIKTDSKRADIDDESDIDISDVDSDTGEFVNVPQLSDTPSDDNIQSLPVPNKHVTISNKNKKSKSLATATLPDRLARLSSKLSTAK